MKTMTCREMGGMCDKEIRGSSMEEMMSNGMKHLEEDHKEMAASVKAMPMTDPLMVEWSKKFKESYDAAPEA